jgi:hypothetical protein
MKSISRDKSIDDNRKAVPSRFPTPAIAHRLQKSAQQMNAMRCLSSCRVSSVVESGGDGADGWGLKNFRCTVEKTRRLSSAVSRTGRLLTFASGTLAQKGIAGVGTEVIADGLMILQ